MISLSDSVPAARKWDAELDTARRDDTWLAFETEIHQSPALRARVARALDRFGLGTSDVVVDEALDYLIHKELGAAARYFNHASKAQFNQQQITHAVLSFMAIKQNQHHITDCAIHDDAADLDDETPGTVRTAHLPDNTHIRPDEYAARRDAVRAINAMIPDHDRELYDLCLAIRENGQRGEPPSPATVQGGIGRKVSPIGDTFPAIPTAAPPRVTCRLLFWRAFTIVNPFAPASHPAS